VISGYRNRAAAGAPVRKHDDAADSGGKTTCKVRSEGGTLQCFVETLLPGAVSAPSPAENG
jgi:hypothetical protein